MIRYALKCANDHDFESWFQSAEAFDRLLSDKRVSCVVCGTDEVTKSLMAPTVRSTPKTATPEVPMLSKPASDIEAKLAELRRRVEESSDYVGSKFAAEARAMHDGEAPQRSIYGEARIDEAKSLIEDGIPVAPLPFLPARKAN